MDKHRNNLLLLLLVGLTLYFPYLQENGWDLINLSAWDFPSFYYGASLTFEQGLTPYSAENWAVAETLHNDILYAFLYVPTAIPFFRVLNLFSYETAKLIMLVLNHILFLVVGWLILRKLLGWQPNQFYFLSGAVYLLSFTPITETIRLGQVNLLILLLLLLMWFGLSENWHPAITGGSLAVATILKFNPLIFFVYLVIKKRYREMIWGGFILVSLSVAATLILPSGIWEDWIKNVLVGGYGETIRGLFPSGLSNQGINGFTSRLFLGHKQAIPALIDSPLLAKIVPYLFSLLVTGLVFFKIWRDNWIKPVRSPNLDLEISLVLVVMYLITPLSWNHHLVFLLPPLMLYLRNWLIQEEKRIFPSVMFLFVMVVLSFAFPYALGIFRRQPLTLLISIKFFAVSIFWVLLLIEVFRTNKH